MLPAAKGFGVFFRFCVQNVYTKNGLYGFWGTLTVFLRVFLFLPVFVYFKGLEGGCVRVLESFSGRFSGLWNRYCFLVVYPQYTGCMSAVNGFPGFMLSLENKKQEGSSPIAYSGYIGKIH